MLLSLSIAQFSIYFTICVFFSVMTRNVWLCFFFAQQHKFQFIRQCFGDFYFLIPVLSSAMSQLCRHGASESVAARTPSRRGVGFRRREKHPLLTPTGGHCRMESALGVGREEEGRDYRRGGSRQQRPPSLRKSDRGGGFTGN